MDHITRRLSKLEHAPHLPAATFLDDQAVIRDIQSGLVDDRHLAWIDALLRPSIQVQLAAFAVGLRLGIGPTDADFAALDTPATVGIRVLATRGDEPLSDELEHLVSSAPFYLGLPDPFLASMVLGSGGRRGAVAQGWLHCRLVGQALGPDIGQSIRTDLDELVECGRPLGSLFDLRKPHPILWDRISAFDASLGGALVPRDSQWPLLEQLTTATFAE